MKTVSLLIVLVGACVLLGACAVAEQDATAVGNQFQDGLQGRGRIIQQDPTNDSFGPEYR
ncbi:MAG: hypothetical protein WEB60_02945 [Terrimicrobiaceae bacterium]